MGEAVLPFTADSAEFIIPYAVELGVRVREQNGAETQLRGLSIQGAYLLFEEWDIRWRQYQIHNTSAKPMNVLVEHPRNAHYDLFDTPEPAETTEESVRFTVTVAAKTETTLRVSSRRLNQRREEIQRQSYVNLQRFLHQGLIDRSTHDLIAQILALLEKINQQKQRLGEIEQERQKIYAAQTQIQGNMQALSAEGKEGRVRSQYVDRLEATETNLHTLTQEESQLKKEIERLEKEIEREIRK
ncbi:MAG: hypothetical protein M5U34_20675 [Chloroflexi bacterium]|nr:hypothetical protein [Chloroflexota bacterium]